MVLKNITQFSFWEFCVAVQEAVQEGYVFSTDNDKMPTAYVGNYNCVMVKREEEKQPVVLKTEAVVDKVVQPESVASQTKEPQTKRGRKSTS
jgi:hypothetical protein